MALAVAAHGLQTGDDGGASQIRRSPRSLGRLPGEIAAGMLPSVTSRSAAKTLGTI